MAEPARGVALHRAAADAEGVGDLGLGEVEVVAQREHLALAVGQLPHRVEYGVAPVGRERGLVGAGLRGAGTASRAACRATTPRCRSAERDRLTTVWRR